jgi:anti-sigma factor RsiW
MMTPSWMEFRNLRKISTIFSRSLATPVREEEIQAYVDGALAQDRLAAVEAYLALHPSEATRAEDYRWQKLLLHSAFDPVAVEGLSAPLEEFRSRFEALGRRHSVFRSAARMTAVAACVVLALSVGWLSGSVFHPIGDDTARSADFTKFSAEAHSLLTRIAAPTATDKPGNVLVDWPAQGTPAVSRPAPDLKAFGLDLSGGRILLLDDRPVVQLVYADRQQRELSLFLGVRPSGDDSNGFTFVQQGDLSMFYWRQQRLEFSLVGKMARDDLMGLAKSVQGQIGGTLAGRVDATATRRLPLSDSGIRPASSVGVGSIEQ